MTSYSINLLLMNELQYKVYSLHTVPFVISGKPQANLQVVKKQPLFKKYAKQI